jgi:hypothetical protein
MGNGMNEISILDKYGEGALLIKKIDLFGFLGSLMASEDGGRLACFLEDIPYKF